MNLKAIASLACACILLPAFADALDAWDPGDNTVAGATLIVPDGMLRSRAHTLTDSTGDYWDHFKMNLVAGCTYMFYTVTDSSGPIGWGDTLASLLDDSGVYSVAEGDVCGPPNCPGYGFFLEFTPYYTGIHYLRVSTRIDDYEMDYKLYFQQTGTTSSTTSTRTTTSTTRTTTSTTRTTTSTTRTTTSTTRTTTTTTIVPSTLGDAVDAPSLNWVTEGDSAWFRQTSTTHDGVDAAQSGPVQDGQYSAIETSVIGPGTISFWWKVSSEADPFDFDTGLMFWIVNGVSTQIDGEINWQYASFPVPAGEQTIRWSFYRSFGASGGSNCGWVDQVVFTPGTTSTTTTRTTTRTTTSSSRTTTRSTTTTIYGVGDQIACVRNTSPYLTWYVDDDGDRVSDRSFQYAVGGDRPVVGDVNGDGRDDIAITREYNGWLVWHADLDGNGSTDQIFAYGVAGDRAVSGDVNGDGRDDIVITRDYNGWLVWHCDLDGDGSTDQIFAYGVTGDQAVLGDFDGDGIDDFAITRAYNGVLAWHVDTNRNGSTDVIFAYGQANDLGAAGNINEARP